MLISNNIGKKAMASLIVLAFILGAFSPMVGSRLTNDEKDFEKQDKVISESSITNSDSLRDRISRLFHGLFIRFGDIPFVELIRNLFVGGFDGSVIDGSETVFAVNDERSNGIDQGYLLDETHSRLGGSPGLLGGRGSDDPLIGFDYTMQTSASDSWSHAYENPFEGDLIVITVHIKSGEISSISYGGVVPTLIESSVDDWPQTYIYAINASSQPAVGESHSLSISWTDSNPGATSFYKLQWVDSDALSDWNELVSASTYVSSGTSISTDVTTSAADSFVIDAVTARYSGDDFIPDAGQNLSFYDLFESPRGAGSSWKDVSAGTTSISWSNGESAGRIRQCVVAVPLTLPDNYPPVISTPDPSDGSFNTPLDFTWSCLIEDPEGDLFNWTIECSNGQSGFADDELNGTKSLSLSGLEYAMEYTLWVNASDRGSELESSDTFSFTTGALDWWNLDWSYRKEISINHSYIDETLVDFPVLVDITDFDLVGNTQGNGEDIVFATVDKRKLDHDIEFFDSSSGRLTAWVEVDEVSSLEDTAFFMYYGNSGCSHQENQSGTWENAFDAVWHMNDLSGSVLDNSGNGYDGTGSGGLIYNVAGKIGKAMDFDGNSGTIDTGWYPDAGEKTLEIWINFDKFPIGTNDVTTGCHDTNDHRFYVGYDEGKWFYGMGSIYSTSEDNVSVSEDEWVHLVLTGDGSTARLYVNGELEDSIAYTWSGTSADAFHIGSRTFNGNPSNHIEGIIDEVRLSNVARNASWIKASYNNQLNSLDFMDFSEQAIYSQAPWIHEVSPKNGSADITANPVLSVNVNDLQGDTMDIVFRSNASGLWDEVKTFSDVSDGVFTFTPSNMDQAGETYYWQVNATDDEGHKTSKFFMFTVSSFWWDDGWQYRKGVQLESDGVFADLVNFPVLIDVIDSDLQVAGAVQSNAEDIVFITPDGSKLSHEIESFDDSSGHLVAWVNVPLLSSSCDTFLYMYYGNPSCGSQEDVSGVWDSDYVGVWHLNEGSTSIGDSTVFGNDGSKKGMGEPESTMGLIDGGQEYDNSDDYISVADSDSLDGMDNITISAWIYPKGFGGAGTGRIVDKTTGSAYAFFVWNSGGGKLSFIVGDGTGSNQVSSSDGSVSLNGWQHVAATYDKETVNFYVNGQNKGSFAVTRDIGDNDEHLFIGNRADGIRCFDGLIDELRISKTARTSDWLQTSYNLVKNDLINVGEQTQSEGGFPAATNPSPMNGAVNIELNPTLSVYAVDPDGDKMTIEFQTNASTGVWHTIGTPQTDCENGTYYQSTSEMDETDTTYYWKACVKDPLGSNTWRNSTFSFTTVPAAPVILDAYPSDQDAILNPVLNVDVFDYQSDSLTVIFKSNASNPSVWETLDLYSGGNGNYSQTTSNMNNKGQQYCWSVNITDGNMWTNETFSFTAKLFEHKWSYETDAGTSIGPLAVDVDGDGIYEVFATGEGKISCVNGSTGELIWEYIGSISTHSPYELYDLNNDGIEEVVISGGSRTIALHANNGSVYWNVPVRSMEKHLVIADIDGNNKPYVYVSSTDVSQGLNGTGRLRKLNGQTGEVLIEVFAWRPCWGGLSVADVNNDGNFELFMTDRGTNYGDDGYGKGLQCYDADTLELLWYDENVTCSSHCAALIDVTGDGNLEAVIMDQGPDYEDQDVDGSGPFVYNGSTGERIPGMFSDELNMTSHSQFSIYDVDNDGNIEIISSSGAPAKVWDLNSWSLDATLGYAGEPPKMADVMGDGSLEIIGSGNSVPIYNGSTYVLEEVIQTSARASNLVQDIDNDGFNELILIDSSGTIKVYKTTAVTPSQKVRTNSLYYSERNTGAGVYIPPPGAPQPIIKEVFPVNGSSKNLVNPTLSAKVIDYHHDLMNITISTNASGTWQDVAWFNNTGNGWYNYTPTTMDEEGKTYYWQVTAVDPYADNLVSSETVQFTTVTSALFKRGWDFRKKIIVGSDQIDEDLTDFSMVISLTDLNMAGHIRSNAEDVLFTGEDGLTKLDHEIEYYDDSSGELVAWVKVNLSSTVNNVFYLYYGNSTCPSQENPSAVWDDDFVMVHHLQETSGNHLDSTSFGNDGTMINVAEQGSANGQLDGCDYFDGNNNYVVVPDSDSLDVSDAVTISAWIHPDSWGTDLMGRIVDKNLGTSYGFFLRGGSGQEHLSFYWFNGTSTDQVNSNNYAVSLDTWQHAVVTFEQGTVTFYVDGEQKGYYTGRANVIAENSELLYIGNRGSDLERDFDGNIDELRISKIARNASWINAEYLNQYAPNSFYQLGSLETPALNPPSGFTATAVGSSQIDLSWIADGQADTTYVERNLVSSWNLGEGTMVYNDTGNSYVDSGLAESTHYFYQAWSRNNSENAFSDSFVSADATTSENLPPVFSFEHPVNNIGTVDVYQNTVNVTINDPDGDLFDWTIESAYLKKYTKTFTVQNNDAGYIRETSTDLTDDDLFAGYFTDPYNEYYNGFVRLINESGLPEGAVITNATFTVASQAQSGSIWNDSHATIFGILDDTDHESLWSDPSPTFDEYAHTNLGVAEFGKVYGDPGTNTYIDIELNQTGLSQLQNILVVGKRTNVTVRTDYSENVPSDGLYIKTWHSGLETSIDYPPHLTVSYYCAGGTNEGNGSKSAELETPLPPETEITWYVNASDGTETTSEWYRFTTGEFGWKPGWLYRKEISINHSLVVDNLSDFPVLVEFTDSAVGENAQPDGDDFVFVDVLGSVLDHEIEYYDDNSGHLIAWVKIPELSSIENTTLYVYYGNISCPSQQNPSGVWSDGYRLVQHLDEITGTHFDSTGYGNDGSYSGNTQDVIGKIDGADYFDGDDDIQCVHDASLTLTDAFTISAWFNPEVLVSSSNDYGIVVKGNTYQSGNYQVDINDGDALRFYNGGLTPSNIEYDMSGYAAGTWYYSVVTFDGSTITIYLDGESKLQESVTGTLNMNTEPLAIGQKGATGGGYFEGYLDEIRVCDRVRSPAWIETEYYNQHIIVDFLMIGMQEYETLPDEPIISQPSPADEAVDVNLNPSLSITVSDYQNDSMDVYFMTNASGSGWQLIGSNLSVHNGTYTQTPTSMNLYSHTYYWNVNATDAGSGNWTNETFMFTTVAAPTPPNVELIAPLNGTEFDIDTLTFECNITDNTGVENASLYSDIGGSWQLMETKNSSVTTNDSSLQLWMQLNNDSSYGETGSHVYDFSGNGNNGTVNGATFVENGWKDGAFSFDGVDDVINLNYGDYNLPGQSGATMTAWVNPASGQTASSGTIIFIDRAGGAATRMLISVNDDQTVSVKGRSADEAFQICTTTETIPFGEWSHITGVINLSSNTAEVYVNGELSTSQSMSFTQTFFDSTTATNPGLGAIDGYDQYSYKGLIDEPRVYNRVLSSNEIQAIYDDVSPTEWEVSFDMENISPGSYSWNVLAFDTENDSSWAANNWTFTVIPPLTVDFVDPTPDDDGTIYQQSATINVSSNRNLSTCQIAVINNSYENGNSFTLTIDETMQSKWGFEYPTTYIFNVSSVPSNIEVVHRDDPSDPWMTLDEKTESDLFDGIECVRFNSMENKAYVSVGFNNSNQVFVKFLNVSTASYDGVAEYYDNRKATYTLSNDNWGKISSANPGAPWQGMTNDASDKYQASVHATRMFNIPQSIAINSRMAGGASMWSNMQDELDYDDYSWEPVVHTRKHSCSASSYQSYGYEWEILGNRDDILENLTGIPYGQYVFEFILSCGYQDSMLESASAGEFLFLRDWDGSDHPSSTDFTSWNNVYEYYGIGGIQTKSYDSVFQSRSPSAIYYQSDVEELNTAFDMVYDDGGIFYAMWHSDRYSNSVIHDPRPGVNGSQGSTFMRHLDHVANRTDVWYVANGWMYSYRYVAENVDVTGGVISHDYYPMTVVNDDENTFAYATLDELVNDTLYSYRVIANDTTGDMITLPEYPAYRTFTVMQPQPLVSNPSPVDGAVDTEVNPVLSVLVEHPFNETMDVYFKTNSTESGSWMTLQSFSGKNDTYEYIPSVFDEYGTRYYWSVNASDGTRWTNESFVFTTEQLTFFDPFSHGWSYRKNITVNASLVEDDFENFTVLVELTDSDLGNHAKVDGADILFMNSSGESTLLDYEIEYYDDSSGHVVAWVQIPWLSSSVNTTFFMYYGNPSCVSHENVAGTWHEGYRMVQHLDEASGTHFDSTSYGNDGSYSGSSQDAAGIIDGADEFVRVDESNGDFVDCGNDDSLNVDDALTISAWINPGDQQGGWNHLVTKGNDGDRVYQLSIQSNRRIDLKLNHDDAATVTTSESVPLGEWSYVVGTYNQSMITVYVDGVEKASLPYSQLVNDNSVHLHIGSRVSGSGDSGGGAWPFNGTIDEVRISDRDHSAAWILTEYYNQVDPSVFYSVGDEETTVTNEISVSLFGGWNLISMPFNETLEKTDITFSFDGINYSWDEAVSNEIILDFIYGWNRTSNSYENVDIFEPGFGYWVWSYQDNVDLIVSGFENEDNQITILKKQWSIIGSPHIDTIAKENIIVNFDGINYTWYEAVSNDIILDFVYEWNNQLQQYNLADILQPDHGYWMYAFENCILLREE